MVGDQPVDGADPDVGRDVAFLERAEDLVNEHPVAHLDGHLREKPRDCGAWGCGSGMRRTVDQP